MFQTHQKYTGTRYTATVASLLGAFIFVPVVLISYREFSFVSISLASLSSAACLGLAWVSWKHSELTIPTIEPVK